MLASARVPGHHGCMPVQRSSDASLDPVDLVRRVENLIRKGTIAQVRLKKHARVRVKSGELLTNWIPWLDLAAGGQDGGRHWRAPAHGEQCVLLSVGGDTGQAVALVGLFSDAMPQGSDSATVERHDWSATEYMEHDRATGKLTITCETAIEFRVGGSRLVIDRDGVHAEPDLTAGGISSVHHKHGGVESGGSKTSEPQ